MMISRLFTGFALCLASVGLTLAAPSPASAQWAEDTTKWEFTKEDSLTYANSGAYITAA